MEDWHLHESAVRRLATAYSTPSLARSPGSGIDHLAIGTRHSRIVMIWLYRLIFLPALFVLLPWFLWRTRGRGNWRPGFRNRLGHFDGLPPKQPGVTRVWLQAVSVGELLAVIPLVQALRRDCGVEIVLTTTTTTGYALAHERLRNDVAALGFFPVDFWPWSARAWREIAPDLMILAEGERWPEHIHQGLVRGVPLVCVNARLSDRGFRRARRLRALAMPCWRGLTRILAGTETDAQRFVAVGFEPSLVRVTGNIKLDVEVPRLSAPELVALRGETGFDDGLIIVGASTWPGEEAALLDLLRRARAAGLPARLLLVPRHAERRAEIASQLAGSEFSHHQRSAGAAAGPVDVLLADTTGELRQLLQLADLVFVGRSLPPHTGGQTPIEAASLTKPVIFGGGMANFRELADGMVASGAAVAVQDAAELCDRGVELLRDAKVREAMAQAQRAWVQINQGATGRTISGIRQLLRR